MSDMQGAVTIGTSATEIVAADDVRQTGRGGIIYFTNEDVNDVWVGDSGVTTSTGTRVPPGEMMPFRAVVGHGLFGISAAGSAPGRFYVR